MTQALFVQNSITKRQHFQKNHPIHNFALENYIGFHLKHQSWYHYKIGTP